MSGDIFNENDLIDQSVKTDTSDTGLTGERAAFEAEKAEFEAKKALVVAETEALAAKQEALDAAVKAHDTAMALEDKKGRVSAAATLRDTKKALESQPKVTIMIPSTEKDKDDVTIGINGHIYQIKRDVEVPVPRDIAQVLADARQTLYEQKKRPDGEEGMELVSTDVQAIPHSVMAG